MQGPSASHSAASAAALDPHVATAASADGVWLTDSEGHRILDGMAGLWCVALGYGREELAQALGDPD